MSRVGCRDAGILCAGSNDNRNAGLDQSGDTFLSLRICQERPVTHRAAVDDSPHSCFDEPGRGANEGGEIGSAPGIAGSHQSRDTAPEDIRIGRRHEDGWLGFFAVPRRNDGPGLAVADAEVTEFDDKLVKLCD